MFVTSYANARQLIAWVLGLGEHARILSPPELAGELRDRVELLIERHTGEPRVAALGTRVACCRIRARGSNRTRDATDTTRTQRSGRSGSPGW